jgi:hypothetical protein
LEHDTDEHPTIEEMTTEELARDLKDRIEELENRARRRQEEPRFYESGSIRPDLDDQEIAPPG